MAGHQRDTDARPGRYVRVPEAIAGLMRAVGHAVGLADSAVNLGRKPKPFVPRADADRFGADEAYLTLSWLLLEVLASGRSPGEVGRRAGGLVGRAARGPDSGGPDDALVQLEKFFDSRGFMPRQIGSGPEIGFVLGRCPYEQAALANPSVVCGLHRALAEGMLDAMGGAYEVTRLVARHPTTAGCRFDLRATGRPE